MVFLLSSGCFALHFGSCTKLTRSVGKTSDLDNWFYFAWRGNEFPSIEVSEHSQEEYMGGCECSFA